jgi:polygalacturonase
MKKMMTGLACLLVCWAAGAQPYYNVLQFGARNDSSRLATPAIRKAIDAAAKAGGGTVYFPAGKYLTGPIHLKSNITLLIDAGAELHFSDDFDQYLPAVQSRWEGTDVVNFSPLFYAWKAENICITGRGLIDGHGKKWWNTSEGWDDKKPRPRWSDTFARNNRDVIKPDEAKWINRGFLRPPFIQPMYCRNVRIQGITIRNSPFWTVNPEFCENVTIEGVTIQNPPSPNTDGINPESCKYVHISNCHISVGDDCITIKSGKDRAGRQMNAPAEDYTITNCTMLSGHGGVVIGSEMSGGVKKIVISNCIFDGTDRGIRIKTTRGRGGVVEDIRVSNIVMKGIRKEAIVLDMVYAKSSPEPVTERTPVFRNMHFSNITAETNYAAVIGGLEESPVENITFNDLQFDSRNGFLISHAKNISLHNVVVNSATGTALQADSVLNLDISNVGTVKPLPAKPVLQLKNVQNVFVHNCFAVDGTGTFLDVSGASRNLVVKGNHLLLSKEPVRKEETVQTLITE